MPITRRILITGGNTKNQGAFMMTLAAAAAVREFLHAQPVVEMHFGTGSIRAWYGLQPMIGIRRIPVRIRSGRLLSSGPASRLLPWATEDQIDAIVDASGFVFGDQWAGLDLERRARYFKSWSKRDRPVYLLPQAFGPFEKTQHAASVAVNASVMVFARDPESLHNLQGLRGVTEHVQILSAPDFTVTQAPEVPRSQLVQDLVGSVPIVPNWNIAVRDNESGRRYIDTLVSCAFCIRERGFDVVGLCHEGVKDRRILEAVGEAVSGFPIVDSLNGLEAKWFIAHAPFAVSGRFHAIVSALSQGVPVLMHGWSHKYQALANEYGVETLLVDPYSSPKDVYSQCDDLIVHRADYGRTISTNAVREKNRVTEMWRMIAADMDIRRPA